MQILFYFIYVSNYNVGFVIISEYIHKYIDPLSCVGLSHGTNRVAKLQYSDAYIFSKTLAILKISKRSM